MTELEINSAAIRMRRLHRDGAQDAATVRAEALLAGGNAAGFHTWTRVATAIGDLDRRRLVT